MTSSRWATTGGQAVRRLPAAGFGQVAGADEVFGGPLLLTRVSEPASKLDIVVKPAYAIVPAFG